jgi:hypothetical protein
MYTRTRRKKRTTSTEATTGERDADEEDDDVDSQLAKLRQYHHQQRDLSTIPSPNAPASLPSVTGKNLELIFPRKKVF